MPLGRSFVAIVATSLLLTGCSPDPAPPGPAPIRPQWQEISLPMPAGLAGRIVVREAVVCEGTHYVLGGVATPAGDTRPAIWTSDDGRAWRTAALEPRSYYGERSILYAAACRGREIAIIGSKVGGAHGNPRTSTWYQRPDGSFTEVLAEFELYGGPDAINVSRIAAAPSGWMIVGNRYTGAAVWTSPDAKGFTLLDKRPELASDDRGETWVADVVYTPAGWVAVGGIALTGRADRNPLALRSADGTQWKRLAADDTQAFDEFQRVSVVNGNVYAAGVNGDRFAVWTLSGDQWRHAGAFGNFDAKGSALVRAIAPVGPNLCVVVSGGEIYSLWLSPDGKSWRNLEAPASMPAGADKWTSIMTTGRNILLLIDDGARGRIWTGEVSVTF